MYGYAVLILIVVEDGLVPSEENYLGAMSQCLNPCCSGRCSRTSLWQVIMETSTCLNPCCSGQWSRTQTNAMFDGFVRVLILVVVDNGLVRITVGNLEGERTVS